MWYTAWFVTWSTCVLVKHIAIRVVTLSYLFVCSFMYDHPFPRVPPCLFRVIFFQRMRARACVRACVRACMHVCVPSRVYPRIWVCVFFFTSLSVGLNSSPCIFFSRSASCLEESSRVHARAHNWVCHYTELYTSVVLYISYSIYLLF